MAVEPSTNAMITLDEMKEWLPNTDADDFLQRAINDWSDAVEARCGRTIKSTAHTDEQHDGGKLSILLRNIPVTAVSAISVDGGVLGSSDYTLDPVSGIIRMWNGRHFRGGPGSVLVSYTAGYSAVPGDIRLAVKKLVALEHYLGPGRRALAKRSESTKDGSVTYERSPQDQERIIAGIERKYKRR